MGNVIDDALVGQFSDPTPMHYANGGVGGINEPRLDVAARAIVNLPVAQRNDAINSSAKLTLMERRSCVPVAMRCPCVGRSSATVTMVRKVLACVAVAFLLTARPAFADESAAAANQLLAVQIADAVTTREMMRLPWCYERNPIAQPFVRSDASMLAMTIVSNLLVRRLFRHAPRVVRILTAIDGAAVLGNFYRLSR